MTYLRLRQFAALVVSMSLLVGLPWVATALSWPTLEAGPASWRVHLASGRLPPGVGTALLIAVLWGLWALYLTVVATEVVARLRGGSPRLGFLRPLHLLSATAVGSVLASPAAVHAAPAPSAGAEEDTRQTANDLLAAEAEPDTGEADEPFLVERSRTVDGFAFDSEELDEDIRTDVAVLADLIAQHGAPEVPVTVVGHTDAAGDAEYNLDLAERRAEAVAQELRTHLGEDIAIDTRGQGVRELLDEEVDDSAQRRVEIDYSVLVTPEPPPEETSPPAQSPSPDKEDSTPHTREIALALPGGLILALTSAAAGTVAGMALERRRTRTQVEPDSEDLPSDHHTPPAPPPDPELPPEAAQKADDIALLDLARAPGLGLTGDGAEGAARTLLARALSEHTQQLQVVIAAPDLHTLLDGNTTWATALEDNAPLVVTETVDEALTLLQLAVLARHRQHEEADEEQTEQEQGEPRQFLLIAHFAPGPAREIQSLLAQADGMAVSAVLLGAWVDQATCTIDDQGIITRAAGPFTDLHQARWPQTTPAAVSDAAQARRSASPATADPPETAPARAESTEPEEHIEQDPEQQEAQEPTPAPAADQPGSAPRVSVTVLGPPTLSVDGTRVRPHRRAAWEVLTFLAAHASGVRLDAAAEQMWPHDAPHSGIRRFHGACTSLRNACRPLLGEQATDIITHHQDRYQLNPSVVACDLWRLEELLGVGEASTEPASMAAALYDEFAADTDYAWAEQIRVRIRESLVTHLVDSANTAEASQALSLLRRALEVDPTHSEVAHDLIARHAQTGDQQAARRIYAIHCRALAELDAEPEEKIRNLLSELVQH